MSKINDGLPAFPPTIRHTERDGIEYFNGMSLRDWFAGMALQGKLCMSGSDVAEEYASDAYKYADAMLAARGKV